MNNAIVEVDYQYVNDLYFRVRHACLESEIYRLDFWDWVRAGVAFNVRGTTEPSRKVAYFVELYKMLEAVSLEGERSELQAAVMRYYEDLFQLYQDHLVAQLQIAYRSKKNESVEPNNLILLPSFDKTPFLREVLPSEDVSLADYDCQNIDKFRKSMATVYATEGSLLFRCMSMLFDYGVQGVGDGILLGVK